MYALVRNGQIEQVGTLPKVWFDGQRWWDLRPEGAEVVDWRPVVETPRPEDTDTHVHEETFELVDGEPTQVWVAREWTEQELAAQAEAEQWRERTRVREGVLDATMALMEQAHTDGEPWSRPTGAHDAYPADITVTHDGKTWVNLTPANVWEPGETGWRETATGDEPAAWVQPTGAHDAYDKDDRVTHEGQVWVSTVDDNVWEPGVHGWALDG